ncbi:hypothetical protein ES703_114078 [subsurface metagenome]
MAYIVSVAEEDDVHPGKLPGDTLLDPPGRATPRRVDDPDSLPGDLKNRLIRQLPANLPGVHIAVDADKALCQVAQFLQQSDAGIVPAVNHQVSRGQFG